MKVKDLTEELEEKPGFKEFKEKHSGSFFAAGFFILDLEEKTEKIQLDYFIPEEKKIASFEHPFSKEKIHEDKIESMNPQNLKLEIDIDDLERRCKRIIQRNNLNFKPISIIAILKDNIWNLTCRDNMLGMIRIKLHAKTQKELLFEKCSLIDFIGLKKL